MSRAPSSHGWGGSRGPALGQRERSRSCEGLRPSPGKAPGSWRQPHGAGKELERLGNHQPLHPGGNSPHAQPSQRGLSRETPSLGHSGLQPPPWMAERSPPGLGAGKQLQLPPGSGSGLDPEQRKSIRAAGVDVEAKHPCTKPGGSRTGSSATPQGSKESANSPRSRERLQGLSLH